MAKEHPAVVEYQKKVASAGGRARQAQMTDQERADMARSGAEARNANLSAKKRKEIARKAAAARWAKKGRQ